MILSHRRRIARREARSERGATLVEMAIVSLLLIMLVGGSFDYGMAWRVGLVTNEAARTAARTGSAMGDDPQADYYALSGAKAALQNSGRLQDVQRVVIFRADDANGSPPSDCLTKTSTDKLCNIITGSQFRGMTSSSFNNTTGCFTAATVKNWCPNARDDVQLTADYYGVWISTKYNHQFKWMKSSTTVSRDAVMRIEPEVS